MFFNEIFNSANEISLGTESQEVSVWAFQSQNKSSSQKHKTNKPPPKTLPYLHQSKYLLYTKRSTLSKSNEVRRERLYQPNTAKYGVLHFSVTKKQLMDEAVMPSSQQLYDIQNSFISLLLTFRKQHC